MSSHLTPTEAAEARQRFSELERQMLGSRQADSRLQIRLHGRSRSLPFLEATEECARLILEFVRKGSGEDINLQLETVDDGNRSLHAGARSDSHDLAESRDA